MLDANLIQMSRQEYGKYGSEAMIKVWRSATTVVERLEIASLILLHFFFLAHL